MAEWSEPWCHNPAVPGLSPTLATCWICSRSAQVLTSCQFTNEPNREISRGVFQNRGVCGQAFPLLPSPSPFNLFFASALSNFRE